MTLHCAGGGDWQALDGTCHVYLWRDGSRWGGQVVPRAQAGCSIIRVGGARSAQAVIDVLLAALDVYDWRPPKPNPHPCGTCAHWTRYTAGPLGSCTGRKPDHATRETEGAECAAWKEKP